MNSKYIDELNKNLDKLIANDNFRNKYIVVFGANKPAEKTILHLKSKNIYVDAIIDNSKSKAGKKMLGITIYTPEELLTEFIENAVILIASQYYKEMKTQLERMKYIEEVNIFRTIRYKNYTVDKEYFDEKVSDVIQGYDVYRKIIGKYGDEKTILICPYRGIGDIYFISSYLNEYLIKNNVKEYVLVVVGNTCKRVAAMFNIGNIEVLEQSESDNLVDLYRMIKNEVNFIKVLSHNYIHTDILNKFESSNKLFWGELFKYGVLEIDENSTKTIPLVCKRSEYVEELFAQNNLIRGKTVILSPYANTIVRLEDGVWEEIVEQLNQKGYKVCTNSVGAEEPPIEKSIPLEFPLEEAVSVIEYAGTFIGVRSGFCDLISNAKAKKIVLYPDNQSLFFSIKEMGLSDDISEIVIG
ncbi:hypothetical protein B0P06_003372 [Clostridium saccharoperbutylacetonicum]|uniref:ADP-heptose:LPS heptosyltransferase n=1 Tax=Clostridium saccharoperbutylacetonicum N1-4(HMT) TaxID=931276 RepID=M1MQ48_9CLOT|nr:ADP-heptose--LPS heptosyltransferase [Clostridium saccharoperbutylacetonicum]AGF58313.1 ADP-heptose:LPS heptosyltransferase [Clostridium saccharoperbutylacetonicum N1-4(HMT)]NRT60910.1 hypothetical protein [Clostridium saccharoperbutylacetonicum]NSB24223.1 hypothetical protein [Clostridium saccharoperbutylacetonicum]NSB43601.1 hypothetical protein [Clostridium saccharoperbutylacetonicum]